MVEMAVNIDEDKLADFRAALIDQAREEANGNGEEAYWRHLDRLRTEKLHRENKTLWIHHHGRMAEEHARLSAEHERKAKSLLTENGVSNG